MKLIPAAAYVRVSHEEQAKHGFSIEAQKKGLEEYAKKKGLVIVDWYIDEGKSARKNKTKRKEYLRLIEDVKQKKFEIIIFKCIDRWFRDIKEYYRTQDILERNGVDWECSEEEYDTTTREGRMKLNLYLMLAQDEADKTSERIKYVFDNKVKNGEPLTGSQPYGFCIKTIDGVKRVVMDDEVSDIVKDIFNYFEIFNSKRATLFYIQDKYNIDMDYKLITKVLTNPLYCGEYRGIDNYVYGDAYITKERFNDIQDKLKRNIKVTKNKHTYIFTSLMKCKECGRILASGINFGTINKDGDKKLYKNYKCNHAYIRNKCTARGTINEKKIENMLVNTVDNEIKKFITEYEISLTKRKPPKIDTASIREEMVRLNKQWRKGRITEQEYDFEYDRLEKRLEKAEQDEPEERDLTPLYEFLNSDWKDIYHTLEDSEKRALWRSIIKEIIFDMRTKKFDIIFL